MRLTMLPFVYNIVAVLDMKLETVLRTGNCNLHINDSSFPNGVVRPENSTHLLPCGNFLLGMNADVIVTEGRNAVDHIKAIGCCLNSASNTESVPNLIISFFES